MIPYEYFLGVATVFAVVYIGVGIYGTVDIVRHERPSRVHFSPNQYKPLRYRAWGFWPLTFITPLLWPLTLVVVSLDRRWTNRQIAKRIKKRNAGGTE